MPTLFLSHGSPMHAIEPGAAGHAWEALGRALPKPRAILIASAHWETSVPMLTGNPKPETIHDFGGFPAALYTLHYPPPARPNSPHAP
jgi:4,5-DOPA dioxygenase extradiol